MQTEEEGAALSAQACHMPTIPLDNRLSVGNHSREWPLRVGSNVNHLFMQVVYTNHSNRHLTLPVSKKLQHTKDCGKVNILRYLVLCLHQLVATHEKLCIQVEKLITTF